MRGELTKLGGLASIQNITWSCGIGTNNSLSQALLHTHVVICRCGRLRQGRRRGNYLGCGQNFRIYSFQPSLIPEQQAASIAVSVGRAIAAGAGKMDGVFDAAQSPSLD